MGLFGSKESTEEGRESPPQQTTGGDWDESFSDGRWSDWQEDPSDLSEDLDNADESSDHQNLEEHGLRRNSNVDFREQIEVLFSRAEEAIARDRFDLEFAQDWVLRVRDVGHQYVRMGCEEARLENMVMTRALTTVNKLVDGVETRQEEVYDPRQTMAYLYCALGVFPSTLYLRKRAQDVVCDLSPNGSVSLSLLDVLSRYCATKTEWEEMQGWRNAVSHFRLVLNLAEWLEAERAPITFLISTKLLPVLAALVQRFLAFPELGDHFQRLGEMALVLTASALVRQDFLEEARYYLRLLMTVDIDRLPPSLATRRFYVHARLLHNCGQWTPALEYARIALRGATDSVEMRGEIQALIMELTDAQENTADTRNTSGPADVEWLEGTHALENQAPGLLHDTIRQRHHVQMERRRKKTKTVAVSRRGQAPSEPQMCHGQQHGMTPGSFRNTQGRSLFTLHTSDHYLLSNAPASTADQTPGFSAPHSPRKSLLNVIDSDESDHEDAEEWEERDIRFVDSSDEEDENVSQGGCVDGRPRIVTVDKMEEDDNEQGWFERSEEFIANRDIDEGEGDVIELSERQTSYLKKEGRGRGFYPSFHQNPQQLLNEDPRRYKRCQLKIERAHKAIAKVLDKDSKFSEILIEGRSKAGRTYMDDEVVVEVLAEPGRHSGLQQTRGAGSSLAEEAVEMMAHGKVVGLINRVHFANEEHPVFFCTLDEIESHLMKPLCKTVPKIHVMNDNVRKKYLDLVKNRIEIKMISPEGEIQFKGYCDVQPDKREQYVFRVVLLAWRQSNIYPLGAVLDAHIGGKDYAGGLQVLSMQQRVPRFYPRSAVEDTKKIVQEVSVSKAGRDDLTGERLFTIDPPGSKDLDDAISIRTEGTHVVIGVHIADVAAVVKKDSGLDVEARRRAVTFYPLNRQPHCMLPEPLSQGKCSLLPGKERLTFSVFFTFNKNGKQVADPEIRRTVIKSRQQLTYEEVQRVIEGHVEGNVEPSIQGDIRQIHQITSKLREARQKNSMFFVPFEDPRLPDLEMMNDCMAAHSLIEELMVLTNCHIASYLNKRPKYRDGLIVRCHKAPTFEELGQWQDKEGHVTNLVMQLQGKQITPETQLSLNNPFRVNGYSSMPHVIVQRQIWHKLCRHLEAGEVEEARRLTFMDALHPLQCLATNSWMDLMETAEYRCAYGLNRPDLHHFGLALDVYTHFTSPIRRYADLHVQRLLHAALDGRSPDCGPDDVIELCHHINSVTSRQKAFGKGCMALKVAENLQRQPLVFRAYIEQVDNEQLTVFVPSLHKVQDRKQELPFSVLGVSSQPEVITDTALKKDSVTVQWNRRFYDERGTCSATLRSVWQHLNKPEHRFSSSHVVLTICPDLLSETVRQKDWIQILKALTSGSPRCLNAAPLAINRDKFEVEDMSSEKGDGTASLIPVQFKRVYTRGQIVQLQMSAEPKRGVLKPRVEILHTARNACVCTQHVSEPVLTLTRMATRSTRGKHFSCYKEYVKAWMPLLEMEAAVEAGASDGSVVIDNVTVTIKPQTSSNNLLYKGSFTLPAKYCGARCIEFGGKSVDSIRRDEYESDNSFPLDYLCLRYKMDCSPAVVSLITVGKAADMVDKHFTWLAHGSVVQVLHTHRRADDGGEVVVIFALSPSSPKPPPQLMTEQGGRVTLEILPKAEVDRRSQEMLLQLENPKCELAQAIAFGSTIPKLDSDYRRLGKEDMNHEVYLEKGAAPKFLPRNNKAQKTAIQLALTNRLTMIQGPPVQL